MLAFSQLILFELAKPKLDGSKFVWPELAGFDCFRFELARLDRFGSESVVLVG